MPVLLIVWIVVAVLAVLLLGILGYGLLGAAHRLLREVRALQTQVRPVLTELRGTVDRVAAQRGNSPGTSS